MVADDDGFINNARRIRLSIGASEDDLIPLIKKGYIIQFENGVIAITHWLMHNSIRKDRYTPTIHRELKERLDIQNKVYTFNIQKPNCSNHLVAAWQPSGNPEKISLDKVRIVEASGESCGVDNNIKLAIMKIGNELQLPPSLVDKSSEWVFINWSKEKIKHSQLLRRWWSNLRNIPMPTM